MEKTNRIPISTVALDINAAQQHRILQSAIDCVYFAPRDRYFELECLNTHTDYHTDFLRIWIDAEISHMPTSHPLDEATGSRSVPSLDETGLFRTFFCHMIRPVQPLPVNCHMLFCLSMI